MDLGLFHCCSSGLNSHIAGVLAFSRDPALRNARSGSNPSIGCINHFLQLVVG
jgi:hypothetical protein